MEDQILLSHERQLSKSTTSHDILQYAQKKIYRQMAQSFLPPVEYGNIQRNHRSGMAGDLA